jgi:TonB family protein
MTTWSRAVLLAVLGVACGGADTPPPQTKETAARGFEPPVLTNPEVPVHYPPALYARRTEGTVVLRLYVDEQGALVQDSTRIAEGSGVAGLDSAAVEAVPAMRFAPARRDGVPVGTTFLQPVQFRHPETDGAGGGL